MRLLVVLAALAMATPVLACPRGARCSIESKPIVLHVLQLRRAPDRTPWQFSNVTTKHERRIWRRLRHEVNRTVPVVRPVLIVSKAFDTRPTLGFSIGF